MNAKVTFVDGTELYADTIRENYYPGEDGKGRTQLTIIIDSTENLGDIDKFKTIFTATNLASLAITTGVEITNQFVGYTVIASLNFSLLPNAYHYEFSFIKE